MTVHVLATGGTIASHFDGTEWTEIGGEQLVAEAGPHPVEVVVHDVASGPSSNLTVEQMVGIAARIAQLLAEGADGVVVTHGTDTIELTAFVAQLLLGVQPTRRPVVFTGSMRVHSHEAPDGPANIRDAIAVAASAQAVGRDVLVCLEGTLHAASEVTKVNANSVDAFTSAPFAPLGSMVAGAPTFHRPSPERPAAASLDVEVPLVTAYPGIAAAEVSRAAEQRRGIVIEVFGDLNSPQQLWEPIHAAGTAGALVVVASNVFTATRTSELLSILHAVGAGGLTAQKARLAAMAALGTCPELADTAALFHRFALTYDAQHRSTRS